MAILVSRVVFIRGEAKQRVLQLYKGMKGSMLSSRKEGRDPLHIEMGVERGVGKTDRADEWETPDRRVHAY